MRGLIGLLLVLVPTLAFGSIEPMTVTLHPSASVSGETVSLGDVSDFKGCSKELAAKYGAVVIGRAPFSGAVRSFSAGDIVLKLRQAGINPSTIAFAGASEVTVSPTDQPAVQTATTTQVPSDTSTASSPTPTPTQAQTQPKPAAAPIVVHNGDAVTALYEDGPVSITVAMVAGSSGAVGDYISVRFPASGKTLRASILDAQTVSIKE